MDEYLLTAAGNLKSHHYTNLHFVMGNESCDLDSAVASIVYATFLHWQHYSLKCRVCTKDKRVVGCKDDIFVPILNVERDDYELKTEVEYFLSKKGISKDVLVFRNDYNLQELITKSNTNVILVDHHVLAKTDKFLAPFVTEIIDHRPLDNSGWNFKEGTRTTTETVGSCCTLVTQRIIDLSKLMSKELIFFNTYPVCSQLLHATIILDTVNFSKEVNKATPHDVEMVSYLENIIKPDDIENERESILNRLLEARTNVEKFSATQLLKKDVKIVHDIYVPSFPTLVEEFLTKAGALSAVTEALNKSGCSIALLLGMSLKNNLKRDAAICGNGKQTEELAKFLQVWSKPDLQLLRTENATCIHYQQLNLSASRKQYMPALNEFVNSLK